MRAKLYAMGCDHQKRLFGKRRHLNLASTFIVRLTKIMLNLKIKHLKSISYVILFYMETLK